MRFVSGVAGIAVGISLLIAQRNYRRLVRRTSFTSRQFEILAVLVIILGVVEILTGHP